VASAVISTATAVYDAGKIIVGKVGDCINKAK
jgi:hypothetical protein